jgi:hypothetical protein
MAQMTSKSQQKRIAMMKEGEKVREWWINPRSERAVNPMFDGWHEAYTQATTNCIHVIEASAYQKLQAENARLREALELVIGLCEYCGDFSNGTTCGGYDEGQVLANRTIAEAKKALKEGEET